MSNFLFLKHEFEILSHESIKSEANVLDDPEVSAFYARKSLEKSLKFVYELDEELDEKQLYKLSTFELISNQDFKDIVPSELLDELNYIRKIGNSASHGKHNITISQKESLYANKCLYKFQRWIVEVYSNYEVSGDYDILKIAKTPKEKIEDIKNEDSEKLKAENEKLLKELELLKQSLPKITKEDKKARKEKIVSIDGLSEAQTRALLIDLELKEAYYDTENLKKGKDIEYKVLLENGKTGYVDYVLWDEDDTPLAIIEAKKYSKSVHVGEHQAELYAKALEKEFKKDILIFVTNGRVIKYSNGIYPFREIHSFFPKNELRRLLQQKKAIENNKPSRYEINEFITDRIYQKRVIKSVLEDFEKYRRRALLVMATGSGKTRVSASLSDVLIKANWVRKVLFLADRVELVKQAKNKFNEYLSESCTNLIEERDLNSRIHFGTYETVHNLIKKGEYNSAFFDLIIVDEAHRTIYKKYRAIFEYFDAFILGLTATPKDEVHKNTYEFFQMSDNEPTDSYSLDKAIKDGFLVPPKVKEFDLNIVNRGIKYDDLTLEEQEEFEDKFDEDEEEIGANEINERVLNKDTNEKVLKTLEEFALKIEDGNKLGKTIIFAKNKIHAEYIKEIFDLLYPHRKDEAKIIHSEISHVSSLIENFKNPDKNPQIAISVDMLDTGIDVPEILNLVFFKPIKSKTKFWQMIGRGTRLCKNVFGENEDKKEFYILDFCMNFTYFGVNPQGISSNKNSSLKERLFLKIVALIRDLEDSEFKKELVKIIKLQIDSLDFGDYRFKKHRFIIENLQKLDLEFISDEILEDIKTISEYIEDNTKFETQRFQLEILNAQELILKNKDNEKYIKSLKIRCQILKTKEKNVNAVKDKIEIIDKVLKDEYNFYNIDDLETIRKELENIADLSIQKGSNPITTNFKDKILEEKDVNINDMINIEAIKTDIQKRLEEYINNISSIQELKQSELITSEDIKNMRNYVFDMEKNIKDKLEDNEDFENAFRNIINTSNKEVANKILSNFVSLGKYSMKQIELMNEIKNIVFDKNYVTMKKAIISVKDMLFNENHRFSSQFESLSEREQDDIINVVKLVEKIDIKED